VVCLKKKIGGKYGSAIFVEKVVRKIIIYFSCSLLCFGEVMWRFS